METVRHKVSRENLGHVFLTGIPPNTAYNANRREKNALEGPPVRMKILDVISPDAFIAHLRSQTKKDVLRELSERVEKNMPSMGADTLTSILMERENLGSTGIGDGIAIPHGKSPQLDRLVAAFGRSLPGVSFDSMDGKPAHLFFLLAGPAESTGMQLKALTRISRLLINETFRQRLMAAGDADDLRRIFKEGDDRS
jgi:PTS system nitrogen regulatory IIA component